jgi:Fur family ferric uptake transcriptional regulator
MFVGEDCRNRIDVGDAIIDIEMATSIQSYEDAMQDCRSMRLSQQRQFVVELLWHSDEHLSAKQIYAHLNQQGKPIGFTSVNHNLDALTKAKAIERIDHAAERLDSSRTAPRPLPR